MTVSEPRGPLSGLKIIEMAGIGPGPFCAMLLADLGADILRIDRMKPSETGGYRDPKFDLLNRGRRSVAVNLKNPKSAALILDLVKGADALIEGFRPGVMERLNIGPEACMERNPRLVYGRMTGWGQDGPLAQVPGHDINFIAISGALHGIGHKNERPVPPLNLIGDFGGGSLYLALGIVCALLEARNSGKGQVVDAAMSDGVASLMTMFHSLQAMGKWDGNIGTSYLCGAAPYYDVYETADGKYVAVGAIEGRFYNTLLEHLEINPASLPARENSENWKAIRATLAAVFLRHDRDHWSRLLEKTDSCFAPVLSISEAPNHPHHQARGTYTHVDGVIQPGPAPKFSRTPGAIQGPPPLPGAHTRSGLIDWGVGNKEIDDLIAAGVLAENPSTDE